MGKGNKGNKFAYKNRSKGDYYEYKTIHILEADGWYVIRAGGSLGMFDFIAVKYGEPLRLIQCKSTVLKYPAYINLYHDVMLDIQNFKAPDYAQKELWIWYYRRKDPEIRIIT
jgi:hypothetical protein